SHAPWRSYAQDPGAWRPCRLAGACRLGAHRDAPVGYAGARAARGAGAAQPAAFLPSVQAVAWTAPGALPRLAADRAREATSCAGGLAGDGDRPHPRLQRDEFVLRGVPASDRPDPDRLPAPTGLTGRLVASLWLARRGLRRHSCRRIIAPRLRQGRANARTQIRFIERFGQVAYDAGVQRTHPNAFVG